MGEALIKGGAIREFLVWYERRFGPDSLRSMAQRVPADCAALLDPDEPVEHLLAASWYPARLVHAMLDVIREDHGDAQLDRLIREATREVVKNRMTSVYKVLFKHLVSPEMYALTVPRMWRQLHDTGERSLTIDRPGHGISRMANWPAHHPALCTLSQELMCAVFEAMGCKSVRLAPLECIARGATGNACSYEVTWDPT